MSTMDNTYIFQSLRQGKILDTINEISDGKYMYIQEMKTNIVRCSEALKEYFGLDEVYMEAQSDSWTNRIHPRDMDKFNKELTAVLNGEKESFLCCIILKMQRVTMYFAGVRVSLSETTMGKQFILPVLFPYVQGN